MMDDRDDFDWLTIADQVFNYLLTNSQHRNIAIWQCGNVLRSSARTACAGPCAECLRFHFGKSYVINEL